jgi:CheY-like chemotaxis protein
MGKKILLADDSITIQKVIELTFSDEDFDVVTVGNGRLAIEKFQDVRPDLVLCDIIMPEKDGYEVCDFIKKHPTLSHTPVLLLTGAFEPFDQERASRVGCDGFLAKPFEPQTLIAKVKDLLGRGAAAAPAPVAAPPAPAPPVAAAPTSITEERPPWSAPPIPSPAETVWKGAEPSPAPPWSPPAPAPAAPAASFFTDETFGDETPVAAEEPAPPPPPAAAPSPAPPPSYAPAALSFEDFGEPGYEAPEPSPAQPAAAEPAGFEAELYPVEEAGRDDLLPVTEEESSTLAGEEGAPPAGWTSPAVPTIEVPLEVRAQASVEQMEGESLFEEVFEDAPSAPAPPAVAAEPFVPEGEPMFESEPSAEKEPEAAPAVAPEPAPVTAAAPPPLAAEPEEAEVDAFADLTPEPEEEGEEAPAMALSESAQVGVPADMVSQIAQRVVAQISEKVIREIAWEVIPDLAETLIRREIERLKADLG